MNPDNTKKLCHDFPELYETDFPFCCGNAWMGLLYGLSRALVDHSKQAALPLVVTDVKEKHGFLRFYADGTDAEADRLIDEAESASEGIPDDGQ
jgi:hypothetical protein